MGDANFESTSRKGVANGYSSLDATIRNVEPPKKHASEHVDATDDIQSATVAQKGLMTATQASKLDGIAARADVTGSNQPQAHHLSHEINGTDKVDVDRCQVMESYVGKTLLTDGANALTVDYPILHYEQLSQPTIRQGQVATWKDTNDNSLWLLTNLDGTIRQIELEGGQGYTYITDPVSNVTIFARDVFRGKIDFCGFGAIIGGSTTRYILLLQSTLALHATESYCQWIVPDGYSIWQGIKVRKLVGFSQPYGSTCTINLRKNGVQVATKTGIELLGGAFSVSFDTDVVFAAGDLLSLQIVTGSGGGQALWNLRLEYDHDVIKYVPNW